MLRQPVPPAARPGLPRSGNPGAPDPGAAGTGARPELRTGTGLALIAGGAILLLAIHVRLPILNLQTAGVILLATGLSWLSIPWPGKRRLMRRVVAGLRAYLERDAVLVGGVRRPLAELLAPEPDSAAEPGTRSSTSPGLDTTA
jgi:hypothetical protein